MLAVNGVLIFLNFNKSAQIEEKNVTIVDQKKEIETKNTELKAAIAELEEKKLELAKYGADTTRLHDELESVKERFAGANGGGSGTRWAGFAKTLLPTLLPQYGRSRDGLCRLQICPGKRYAA